MKFTVSTKEIQDVTKKLLKVTPKHTNIEILRGILITVTKDSVTLSATDTNIYTQVKLKTTYAHEAGTIIVPKDTIDIIAKMKSDTMEITDKQITAGNRKISFVPLDPEVYPNIPSYNYNETAFILSAERFNKIAEIRFACGNSESQPIFKGILFRNNRAYACDRHRLALRDVSEFTMDRDVVIPSNVFDHALNLTEKRYNGEYKVTACTEFKFIEHAKIEFDNVAMYVRLLDGQYPDVSKIIPQNYNCSVTVNKKEFTEELTLLKEVTDTKAYAIKIKIDNDKIKLSASTESNKLESEITAQVVGEIDPIGFNAELLLDGLKHNSNDVITLNLTGITSPAMIDNDYLVLPYRAVKSA